MKYDLTEKEQLVEALSSLDPRERNDEWRQRLEDLLVYVRNADVHLRGSREFHQKIWEDNAVSAVGMGTVDISGAIADKAFREWFAHESMRAVGDAHEERIERLREFHDAIVQHLKPFSGRVPRVKIFRVLAALYPRYFTTITNRELMFKCHRALFGKTGKPDAIRKQLEIRNRIDQVLGPCADTPRDLAERMTIAWFLYTDFIKPQDAEDDSEQPDKSGEVVLNPLPAQQRRKGLTAIRGGAATISSALSFVVDGVTRQDLFDFLRTENPDYRESTVRTLINILKNEFYVIQESDGLITPTDRGLLFLETEDPQELIPPLLSRILGVDHVVVALSNGGRTTGDLIAMLMKVNPGLTSEFAPRAMLKWLRDFDLIQVDGSGTYTLTETGKTWREAIHWEPQYLDAPDSDEDENIQAPKPRIDISRSDQAALINYVTEGFAISPNLVQQLHLGLWSHPRRHFAILAGLSGSGKTLLAQRYAKALAAQFVAQPERNVFVLAVQPGWYDPTPLFGYINPLMPDNYVRPPFLDFLLLAARYPEEPFIVILDEMNLSHPEQYFAPVLSAMESGEQLRLHNEGASFDGVPSVIPYPANVAFLGTVNMDETTHGISDKVLDRAFTLEFWNVDLDAYPGWDVDGLTQGQVLKVKDCLESLLDALSPERMHFGWRTVEDILSYLGLASKAEAFDLTASLDDVVYARVLPKLRGAETSRLHDALKKTIASLEERGLERSCKKVRDLKNDLSDTGMMRFWR